MVVDEASNVRVDFVYEPPQQGGAETLATCQRGVDNDCNGLAGPLDPACLLLLRNNVPRRPRILLARQR